MSKKIYPAECREGAFTHQYCEIAMESYYLAMQAHTHLKRVNYCEIDTWDIYWKMNKGIISTVVFSAMAIESFLNDYAAACLGDDEYYQNFDRLSAVGKFQLIAKFIMRVKIDKSRAYYFLLKMVFSNRDKLVHNKSKKSTFQGYTKEELDDIERSLEVSGYEPPEPYYDVKDIAKDMHMGLDALRAIREMVSFFDAHDESVCALFRFFGSTLDFYVNEPYKKEVFRLLKIPIEKCNGDA